MPQGECGKGFIQKTWSTLVVETINCTCILFPRPTQSQCLQLLLVGPKLQIPNQHSAAVAHLSASFLHRRASVKLEKNWKLFQRKPSVLNIRGAITSLICQLCSAKSCKSYSTLQQAFSVTRTHCWLTFLPLRTCQSFSAEMPPGQRLPEQQPHPMCKTATVFAITHSLLAHSSRLLKSLRTAALLFLQCPDCFSQRDVTCERAEGTFCPTTEATDENVGQSSSSIVPLSTLLVTGC